MQQATSAFASYRARCFREAGGYSACDGEIELRLAQMSWTLSKVARLQEAFFKLHEDGRGSVDLAIIFEMELMTETFYFLVGRLNVLFECHAYFGKIPPKVMALKVRHGLLQHPETQKERAKLESAFEVGTPSSGPVIKPYIGTAGALVDPGLFENARELDLVLARKIEQVRA